MGRAVALAAVVVVATTVVVIAYARRLKKQGTLAKWKENGEVTVIEDLDVEAIKAKAREHFSSGLPYSETYVKLLEDLK